ncbi:hypothetical protein [Streptomyces sp. NBC_01237]|nr:hypothetical protein [Streptomyces sp. NBC_01237]WRZ76402.1 hypothetical protein OG251_34945 [Streptomyces sp. NBC_01237]
MAHQLPRRRHPPARVRDGRTGTGTDFDPDPDGGQDAPAPEARPALRLAG